jgi:hypothetical protein
MTAPPPPAEDGSTDSTRSGSAGTGTAEVQTHRRTRRAVLALAAIAVVLVGLVVVRTGRESPAPGERSAGPSTTAVPTTSPTTSTVAYVAPSASGAGDGSTWEDAAALADVPELVSRMPQGGEIWLRADAGPFQVEDALRIDSGGASGSPVVVRGVDAGGAPAKAVLVGDRTTPYDPEGDPGGDVFSLRGGAAHLVFRDLAFENVGNVFLAAGDVTGVVISDSSATNVRRFFENAKSDEEDSAVVSDLTIRGVTVTGFSKRFLRLRYSSHDVLVEDVVGDSQQQDGDDFAIGVHLEEEVHDVVLRRVSMSNTRDTLRDYWNGDGFATEADVYDITFEDTSASGNTDAGYDLKSRRTTLVNAVASDNKRNFRVWADDLTARDCQGLDPQKRGGSSSQAQVWLGERAVAELDGCTFRSADPETVVFDLEPDARLVMAGGSIEHAGKLQNLQDDATVDLSEVAR